MFWNNRQFPRQMFLEIFIQASVQDNFFIWIDITTEIQFYLCKFSVDIRKSPTLTKNIFGYSQLNVFFSMRFIPKFQRYSTPKFAENGSHM